MIPSNQDRAAYFSRARTSTAAQVARESRLWRVVDFGMLVVLRVVGVVGRVVGRKR